MRKNTVIFGIFIILSIMILNSGAVFADQTIQNGDQIYQGNFTIHFFGSDTCPHCARQEKFLETLKEDYPQITVIKYRMSDYTEFVNQLYEEYDVPPQQRGYVPVTFTPDEYFVGFNDKIATDIENCIKECLIGENGKSEHTVKLPLLGNLDIENLSLPVLAAILGFFDGFNICSLGALVLILGIVMTLKSKKKILLFGGVFILITVLVYGTLVFLWHQLFTAIMPYIRRMEILIGVLALAGGIYFFREFLKSKKYGATCSFGGVSNKFAEKIRKLFDENSGILIMLGAVFMFAAVITLIEFPCSAFFPVLFTGVLAQSQVPLSLALFYIGIYSFFYMLNEIIVLIIAVCTMKIWIASPKFITWTNFAASLLFVAFGLYHLVGSLVL